MNRKNLLLLVILVIGVLYYFRVDKLLYSHFINHANSIKSFYISLSIDFKEFFKQHTQQAQYIQELQKQNQELTYENIKIKQSYDVLESIYDTISSIDKKTNKIQLIEVLSYVKFSDHTKVWLDYRKDDQNIDALIYGDYSAGIVQRDKEGNTFGLLNGNKKCNYAVFVGENKAPGILHSARKNSNILLIKYIPSWIDVYLGDEVVTSGMDNIFPSNLKVGKVIKIEKFQDTQEVEVKPYINVLQKKFFYLYRNSKPVSKQQPHLSSHPQN
jgi:rod shape-determining protein MreC